MHISSPRLARLLFVLLAILSIHCPALAQYPSVFQQERLGVPVPMPMAAIERDLVRPKMVANYLTLPFLQNVKPSGITIMWELDALVSAELQYGLSAAYGSAVAAAQEDSGHSSHIYKAVITGLSANTLYHFRIVLNGGNFSGDRAFKTAPTTAVDFQFGIWGDSQGTNHGAYPPDPLEPTKSMMSHMAANGVDIAVGCGDFAENGGDYADTRSFYLDRVSKYLGQTVPYYAAWGNHEPGRTNVLRKFADMPSKDRPGYDPGWGSFSFDYARCHLVCYRLWHGQ